MAKYFKARKKCIVCKKVFYPRYSGTMYCDDCKKGKKLVLRH